MCCQGWIGGGSAPCLQAVSAPQQNADPVPQVSDLVQVVVCSGVAGQFAQLLGGAAGTRGGGVWGPGGGGGGRGRGGGGPGGGGQRGEGGRSGARGSRGGGCSQRCARPLLPPVGWWPRGDRDPGSPDRLGAVR